MEIGPIAERLAAIRQKLKPAEAKKQTDGGEPPAERLNQHAASFHTAAVGGVRAGGVQAGRGGPASSGGEEEDPAEDPAKDPAVDPAEDPEESHPQPPPASDGAGEGDGAPPGDLMWGSDVGI